MGVLIKPSIELKQYFFVTSALTKLKNYVNTCETCNLRKNPQIYPNPTIGRTPTARFPFDIVSFDLYGTSRRITHVQQRTYLRTFSNRSFFWFHISKPLKTKSAYATSKALAKIFLNFGVPNTVLSDNGPNFVSKVTKDLMSFLQINKLVTTPYHPQANGKIENRHKLFSNILGIYTKGDDRRDWHETLPYLTNVINTAFSPVIRDNPFYILFGRDFRIPYNEIKESRQYYNDSEDYKQEFINRMRKTYKLVKQEIEKSKIKQEAKNIQNVKGELNFQIGDCVYLKNENKADGKKLSDRYSGPYRIIKKYDNNVTFKLLKPKSEKIYKTHISRIKRAKFTEHGPHTLQHRIPWKTKISHLNLD